MPKKKGGQSRPMLGTNRLLKNAFFKKIYEHEEYLLDAASLLANRKLTYTELANVEPILFGSKENDLAFLVDDVFYFMIEAQSTWNPNMSLRCSFVRSSGQGNRKSLAVSYFGLHCYGVVGICGRKPALWQKTGQRQGTEALYCIHGFDCRDSKASYGRAAVVRRLHRNGEAS